MFKKSFDLPPSSATTSESAAPLISSSASTSSSSVPAVASLPAKQKLALEVMVAHALIENKEFARAEALLKDALQHREAGFSYSVIREGSKMSLWATIGITMLKYL